MKLAIMWTDDAQDTFDSIINFIESRWGQASAEKFVKVTHKTVNTISTQPYMYIESISSNIRKAVITKQTSMFL